jgi:DNA invertase Pin-like site-specific DNA recombinase
MTKNSTKGNKGAKTVAFYGRCACAEISDIGQLRDDDVIEYCHSQFGIAPVVFRDDRKSGLSRDRKELQNLMAEIATGKIETLVVRQISALSRSPEHLALLILELNSHAELHCLQSGGPFSKPIPMGLGLTS